MWIANQLGTKHQKKGKENRCATAGEYVHLKVKLMNLCMEVQLHKKKKQDNWRSQEYRFPGADCKKREQRYLEP